MDGHFSDMLKKVQLHHICELLAVMVPAVALWWLA